MASLSRCFSMSAAVRSKMVEAPVKVFGTPGRYATALFSAASKEKQLEQVEKDFKKLKNGLENDVKFREFCLSPLVSKQLKAEALESSLTKLKAASVTINTVRVLAENGKMKRLNDVINAFETLLSAQRGEVRCLITSAKPLDKATLTELETTLRLFLKPGEKLLLQTKVNESLMGGMTVEIGDKYVDMSTATKIKTYTNILHSV